MAVLHMVDPEVRVGFEIFPTILFFLAKSGLYFASIFLQGPLLATVLRGNDAVKHVVKNNYILNFLVSAGSITVGGFAFITMMHFRNDLTTQISIMRAYYFCQAGCLLFNSAQAYFVKKSVFKTLDKAQAIVSSSDKTESIKRKIGDLQKTVIKQGFIQGAICT